MVYIECIHTSVLLQYKTWMYILHVPNCLCVNFIANTNREIICILFLFVTVRYQHIGNGKTK